MFSILKYTGLRKFIDEYPSNDHEMVHNCEDFTTISTALVEVLGERGAKDIMFEAGKRAFDLMVEVAPSLLNIEDIRPEEIASENRFEEFLKVYRIMTDAASAIFGDVYSVLEQETGMVCEISPCYLCEGLKTEGVICYIQTGFMTGAVEWIMGKEAKVEEVLCMAKGDDRCRFLVYRV